MNKPLTTFFLLRIGLNEMVPDSLLSVFDEYELEVSAVLILFKTSLSQDPHIWLATSRADFTINY